MRHRPGLWSYHLLWVYARADWCPIAVQDLIDKLDRDLTYAIEVEGKMLLADVSNYNEVRLL